MLVLVLSYSFSCFVYSTANVDGHTVVLFAILFMVSHIFFAALLTFLEVFLTVLLLLVADFVYFTLVYVAVC